MLKITMASALLCFAGCITSDPEPRVHNVAVCTMADDSLSVGHPEQTFHIKDGICVRDSSL